MHPLEQKAKLHVIDDMARMADDAMGDKLKGMGSKVTVAGDSPEALEHGLGAAEKMLKHLPEALDDSHPDHENFAHTEDSEDGEDGMSAYPDADGDHLLEADPEAEHEEDEKEEMMMAHGGEIEHMDEDELNAQIERLMKMKQKKGMR